MSPSTTIADCNSYPETSANLRQYLDALPNELYDEIYKLVFTADLVSRQITKSYKPPAQLQVSRETRKEFAKSYYRKGAVFYSGSPPVTEEPDEDFVREIVIYSKWLYSLERELKHSKSVHCSITVPADFRDPGWRHGEPFKDWARAALMSAKAPWSVNIYLAQENESGVVQVMF